MISVFMISSLDYTRALYLGKRSGALKKFKLVQNITFYLVQFMNRRKLLQTLH